MDQEEGKRYLQDTGKNEGTTLTKKTEEAMCNIEMFPVGVWAWFQIISHMLQALKP